MSDFKEMYNKLVLENQKLVKENKKLKYQADLKDYAMGRAELWSKTCSEVSKERDAYRAKVYDLESKVSALQIELDFSKERLAKVYSFGVKCENCEDCEDCNCDYQIE